MIKMKRGGIEGAHISAVGAGILAVQVIGSILNYIAGIQDAADRYIATFGGGAVVVLMVMAVIKAIPQPIEEVEEKKEKVSTGIPVK